MNLLSLVVTAIIAGGGAFCGAYLKRKGENLATHEDVDRLVAQVSAVTQATKKIESKIESSVWERHRHWELKREVLFEALRKAAAVDDALLSLHSMLQLEQQEDKTGNVAWMSSKNERLQGWSKASTQFDEIKFLIAALCSKETSMAFMEFGKLASIMAADISSGRDLKAFKNSSVELYKKMFEIRTAVRKELGIPS